MQHLDFLHVGRLLSKPLLSVSSSRRGDLRSSQVKIIQGRPTSVCPPNFALWLGTQGEMEGDRIL